MKIELSYKRRRRTPGQDAKNFVVGFNPALLKICVKVHSILDVLGPCSGGSRCSRQVLLAPSFGQCHLFRTLTLWEKSSFTNFCPPFFPLPQTFCNGFHLPLLEQPQRRPQRYSGCSDTSPVKAFPPWRGLWGTFQHLPLAKGATGELEGDHLPGCVVTK